MGNAYDRLRDLSHSRGLTMLLVTFCDRNQLLLEWTFGWTFVPESFGQKTLGKYVVHFRDTSSVCNKIEFHLYLYCFAFFI